MHKKNSSVRYLGWLSGAAVALALSIPADEPVYQRLKSRVEPSAVVAGSVTGCVLAPMCYRVDGEEASVTPCYTRIEMDSLERIAEQRR